MVKGGWLAFSSACVCCASGVGIVSKMTDAWRDTVLEVIKTQPEGCTQELLQSTLEKIDGIAADDVPAIIQDGLNWLLKKGFVELLQQANGSLLYRELDPELAGKLRGLSEEEQAAYNKIKESKDQGIWTRELKKVRQLGPHAILPRRSGLLTHGRWC